MGIQLSSVVRNSEVSADIREQKCTASMGIAVGIYIHGDLLYRGDLLLGGGLLSQSCHCIFTLRNKNIKLTCL